MTHGDDDATVVEVATNGSLGGEITCKDGAAANISELSRRETLLLRGRTLADFINKTKSEKWKALAEILGLEEIEGLRQDLQRAHNDLRKDAKAAETEFKACCESLGLSAKESAEDTLLAKIREACDKVGISPPSSLQDVADETWYPSGASNGNPSDRATGVQGLNTALKSLPAPAFDMSAVEEWNGLLSSAQAADVARFRLLKEADNLLQSSPDGSACPLCGQPIPREKLVLQVREAVTGLQEAAEELEGRRSDLQHVIDELSDAESRRQTLMERGGVLELSFAQLPSDPRDAVRASLRERKPVDPAALTNFEQNLIQWDGAARQLCQDASPPSSETEQDAILELASLCEKSKVWTRAKGNAARLQKARGFADKILKAYQKRQKTYLSKILKEISGRVADIYEKLHPGEGLTGIAVEPWTAKGIELAIDFHGTRQRPPHGVLSESHLNSLAIALFLAMAETFNQKLGFLVLDDVVNSFDLEHRGQLASLLANEFSDWQLIVLTHDHLFFEQLVRRAPAWKKLEFTSWSHEEGPRTTRYETGGMLAKARKCLEDDDLTGAATKARRALEELLQEVCQGIAAPLPFRRGAGNDRREIVELFSGLRRGLDKYAKQMFRELKPLLADLEADVQVALNVEAHASQGKAATSEVRVALERIGQLDDVWSCPSCQTRIWLIGTPQSAMCKCGKGRYPPVPVPEAQSANK